MKELRVNTVIPQPTTTSSANLQIVSTSLVVDPPFKSPFVAAPPMQPSQVGASGATTPKLAIPAQLERQNVASPNPILTARADYAFPHLVPLPPLPPSTTTCRLANCVQNWKHITQDPWVLQSVKGYKIPFMQEPYQWQTCVTRTRSPRGRTVNAWGNQGPDDLIAKGAVAQVEPVENQFTSTIFLVEKENGNGKYSTQQICGINTFKMEGLQVTKSLLQPGDYMMKLDLKDAYYTVPVHSKHCRYLWFIYQSKLYEFCCLPFACCQPHKHLPRF